MKTRMGKIVFWTFLVLDTLAVTWPVIVPFNHFHPILLGMPFVMAWVAFWVALGAPILWWVDRIESRARKED